MILNEKVIQNKILQRTLIQQIIKVQSYINQIPKIYYLIQRVANKIQSQKTSLQKKNHEMNIKKLKISQLKNRLFDELESKKQQKKLQHQNAANEMKKLNQRCSYLRSKKQEINQSIKIQNKLKNEIQEIQINLIERQSQTLTKQFFKIQQQKEQKELLEVMRQKSIFIDTLRLQKQKQKNLQGISHQNLLGLENKISTLNFQKSKLQISQALLISQLQKFQGIIKNVQNNCKISKSNNFQIKQKIRKIQANTSNQLQKKEKNKQKMQIFINKIEKSVKEVSEINDKIITTRQFVISQNIKKNQQKKINQLIRLKLRQLMQMTLKMSKN